MTDFKSRFQAVTRGGFGYEIFEERGMWLYGRIHSDIYAPTPMCWHKESGKAHDGIDGKHDLLPAIPPLTLDQVPLGVQCELLSGRKFTPYWIDHNLLFGRMDYQQDVQAVSLAAILASSITPTREVWLVVRVGGYVSVYCHEKDAHEYAATYSGLVHSVRVPIAGGGM